MKNGQRQSRIKAKGCFGGTIAEDKVKNFRSVRNVKATKDKPASTKVKHESIIRGRDSKGSANFKLVKKMRRGVL